MSFQDLLKKEIMAQLAAYVSSSHRLNKCAVAVNDDDKAKTHIALTWRSKCKGACKATAWFKPVAHISEAERAKDIADVFVAKMLEGEGK